MKSYTLSVLHSCFFLLALKCHTCIFGFLEDINLLCEGLGPRAKQYICKSIKAAQKKGTSPPAQPKCEAGTDPNCKCHCFNKNHKSHDFRVGKQLLWTSWSSGKVICLDNSKWISTITLSFTSFRRIKIINKTGLMFLVTN